MANRRLSYNDADSSCDVTRIQFGEKKRNSQSNTTKVSFQDSGWHNAVSRLLAEHWHLVAAFLMIYDIIAVNLSCFVALWFRYDCKFSAIYKPEHRLKEMRGNCLESCSKAPLIATLLE